LSEQRDTDRRQQAAPSKRASHPPPLDLLPFSVLIVIWLVSVAHYPRLPDLIPLRFMLNGAPLDWSPKGMNFFMLPAVATFAYIALTLICRVSIRRPTLGGRRFKGQAARRVNLMLIRYLFFMKTAVLVFLLNIHFRSIQIAYGTRDILGWDSYLAGGILLGYALAGSLMLYLSARRLMKWQMHHQAGEGAAS
jgi:hypothetical protein